MIEVEKLEKLERRKTDISIGLSLSALLFLAASFFRKELLNISIVLLSTAGFFLISMSMLSKIIKRFKRAKLFYESSRFITSFVVLNKFRNKEYAYKESLATVESKEFEEAWHDLVRDRVTNVEGVFLRLAERLEGYSEKLAMVFRIISSEIKKGFVSDELLSEIYTYFSDVARDDFARFNNRLKIYIILMSFLPFLMFLTLPAILGKISESVPLAFMATALIYAEVIVLLILSLLEIYPSGQMFLSNVEVKTFRNLGYVIAALLLASVFSSWALIILGAVLIILRYYFREIESFVSEIRGAKRELIPLLKEVSIKLYGGMPLELIFRRSTFSLERIAGYPLPIFKTVEHVLKGAEISGREFAKVVEDLRSFVVEMNRCDELIKQQADEVQSTLKFMYVSIPVFVYVPLYAFSYFTRNLRGFPYIGAKLAKLSFEFSSVATSVGAVVVAVLIILSMFRVMMSDVFMFERWKTHVYFAGVVAVMIGGILSFI